MASSRDDKRFAILLRISKLLDNRKFIRNFAVKASPLTDLLKQEQSWEWNNSQRWAFNSFKAALTQALVLHYPDYARQFTVTIDASNYAVGAVLQQPDDSRGMHPIT